MLPVKKESIDVIQRRLRLAFLEIYDCHECDKNPESRPGKSIKHVFDFENGVRMIASFDTENQGKTYFAHLSFSAHEGTGGTIQDWVIKVKQCIDLLMPADRVEVQRLITERALHFAYKPEAFCRHFAVKPHYSSP